MPEDVVKERFNRLLTEVQTIGAEEAKKAEGKEDYVLVEEENSQLAGYMTGRLSNNMLVHFPGSQELLGKLIKVKLNECKGFYYIGERV